MGQCISVPHRKLSLLREGSLRRFYKSKTGNLSATFHVLDSDLRWDLLNVNTATEEQLMTLPGVNRVIARNIVEYRQAIGGFKKVEDLALVSGVGATKLEQFRTEISVGRRRGPGGSYNSSLNQSLESLQNNEGNVFSSRSSPLKLVNVNTANVFQLMSVRGMTQEMAANIVHYRERKGPFKSLDDLLKVKGLPPDRLATVRLYLTVDLYAAPNHNSSVTNKTPQINSSNKKSVNHRRTNSAPCGFGKSRSSEISTKDFFELISSQITRPVLKEVFNFKKDGKSALRVASWNLQKFVLDKAKNPGVREVICRTILENGLSLIAVQEIASRDALSLIVSELNEPQLPNVQNWDGDQGKWQSLVPPLTATASDSTHRRTLVNGFLYDTSRGLTLRDSTVLYLPPEKQRGLTVTCQPFLGWFKVENLDFVVVTFSLISESYVSKLLPSVMELLRERIPGEKNVFLMGDFILPPGHTVFEVITSQGYNHLIPAGSVTNLSSQQEESHLWGSANVRKIFTGHCGVVKQGLNHLAIPNGWQWGGSVSDHCPVWVELFAQEEVPSFPDTPVTNGIRKVSTIPEDADSDVSSDILDNQVSKANEENEEKQKKDKKLWGSNWMWRYNKKNGVTCEGNKINVKENGAV